MEGSLREVLDDDEQTDGATGGSRPRIPDIHTYIAYSSR